MMETEESTGEESQSSDHHLAAPNDHCESPPDPKKAKTEEKKRRHRTPSPWRFPIVDSAQRRRSSEGARLALPNVLTPELSPDSTSVDGANTERDSVNCSNNAVDNVEKRRRNVESNNLPNAGSNSDHIDGLDMTVSYENNFTNDISFDTNVKSTVPNDLELSNECNNKNGEIISPTSGRCSYISSSESLISVEITSPAQVKGPHDKVTAVSLFQSSSSTIVSPTVTACSPVDKGPSSTISSPLCENDASLHPRGKLERTDGNTVGGISPDSGSSPGPVGMDCTVTEVLIASPVLVASSQHSEQNVSSSSGSPTAEERPESFVAAAKDTQTVYTESPSPFKVPSSPVRGRSTTRVDPLSLRCSSPFSPLCSPRISPQSHGKYTITEVMTMLEARLPKLLDVFDFTTNKPLDDLKFVKRRTNYNPDNTWRLHIADKMEELGLVQLLIRIWNSLHQDDGTVNPEALTNIIQVVSTLWNTTDISRSLCEKVTRSGAIGLFLEDLCSDAFSSTELDKNEMKLYYVKGILGIMHNVCRHYRDSRDIFRDALAVETLQVYLESEHPILKIKVLILLAYIITEDENAIIHADDKNLCYIIEILKSAIESDGHFSKKYGFCASELVHGLNHLVANDSNKERVVRLGLLPLYVCLLTLDCRPEEQKFAARGIWILAFNEYCKKMIKEERGSLEGLQLLITNATEEGVRHAARGALWEISARWKVSSISHDADTVISETPHVMISYQWNSKPTMLKVKDRLKSEGYKVWMDVENMSGSTLEAMALAVEKAVVVILCVSQKYKDSPNCRSEAEYTYRLRRNTIPLILQKDYIPDGWLGMMVGTKLYFDFSDESKFEVSIDGLIRELGDRGRILADGGIGVCDFVARDNSQESFATCSASNSSLEEKVPTPEDGPDASLILAVPSVSQPDTAIPAATTPQIIQIQKWLEQYGLSNHQDKFSEFDVELLVELKKMQETAPEFLYRTLQTEFNFKLKDILMLNRALRKSNLHV